MVYSVAVVHWHPGTCTDAICRCRPQIIERESRAANVPLGHYRMSAYPTAGPPAFRPPLPSNRKAAAVFREMPAYVRVEK